MVRKLKHSPLPDRQRPARPLRDWLWSGKGPYDGILFPKDEAGILLPYLEHYQKLLLVDDWLVLIFRSPVELDPALLGHARPLRVTGTGSFTSFDLAHQPGLDDAARVLHIVHQGQKFQYDLVTAVLVDPMEFWDFSKIDVTSSQVLVTARMPSVPRPVKAPGQSEQVAKIARVKPIYDDIHAAIDTAPDKNWRERADATGRVLNGILRLITKITLGIFMLIFFLVIVLGGMSFGLVGLFLAFLFIGWIFRKLTSPRTIGPEGGGQAGVQGAKGAAGRQMPRNRGPGLFDRLKSWMLWNTSMGDKLRAELERHMDDVSKMIERGEIDRALKRAIALGAEEAEKKKKARSAPMSSVPDPRATLDLDYSGVDPPSASILTENGFGAMTTQYRDLAWKLSADGDHRRAAFIYSELLKDVPHALEELEAMKAFEDAAKLATARKSPGHVAARLWFLAGHKDIALALAKRFDALEFVANTAEKSDPEYAAFVRGHWIEGLIAAGDLARAVKESAGRPQLSKLHLAVVNQAVLAGMLDDPNVLVAAVFSLAWRVEVLGTEPIALADDASGKLEARLHHIVNGADEADADARLALVAGLRDAKTMGPVFPMD